MTTIDNKNTPSPYLISFPQGDDSAFDFDKTSHMVEKANQLCPKYRVDKFVIPNFEEIIFSQDKISIQNTATKIREALNLDQRASISLEQLSHLIMCLGVVPVPVGWGTYDSEGSLLVQSYDGVYQWCYININRSENEIKLALAKIISFALFGIPKDENLLANVESIAEEFSYELVMPQQVYLDVYMQVASRSTKIEQAEFFVDFCLKKQVEPFDLWSRMCLLTSVNNLRQVECLDDFQVLGNQIKGSESFKQLFQGNDYNELKKVSEEVFGSCFYQLVDSKVENMPLIEQFDFINTVTGMPLMGNIH